jgi:hypothetical protein
MRSTRVDFSMAATHVMRLLAAGFCCRTPLLLPNFVAGRSFDFCDDLRPTSSLGRASRKVPAEWRLDFAISFDRVELVLKLHNDLLLRSAGSSVKAKYYPRQD